MLSRAILRSVATNQPANLLVRATSSCPAPTSSSTSVGTRDEVNFPRPVRGDPGKTRMGFLPEEWFQFFHKKTGVTGPYMFGVGLTTYLFSKEIYVMEHEYYSGLSILVMIVYAAKKWGRQIGTALDKGVDQIENDYNQSRVDTIKFYEDAIDAERKAQASAKGQEVLIQAKKENILLQLEAAYRERIMNAYREVKRRLDYQVELANVERRITQKHMVDWIVRSVTKSITPDQEKQTLDRCIADLGALAGRVQAA